MVLLNDLEKAPLVWPSSVDALGTGGIAEKATPRPHQVKAIEETASGLADRGQMIMACGTGKTLTALWMAEKLGVEAYTGAATVPPTAIENAGRLGYTCQRPLCLTCPYALMRP